MKKLITTLLVFLFAFSLNAQTVTILPMGASEREVAADETGVFNLVFNGLENVGVQTQMYLKGSSDVALSSQSWMLISKPAGSAANISAATALGANSEVVIFVPDVAGTYEVIFTSSAVSDTLVINAGLFVGTRANLKCATCHKDMGDLYATTGHSIALKRQLDAMEGASSHFSASCLRCHTTGYDENADNHGFDDFDFEYPDEVYDGKYDELVAKYPDAMGRADVQCEACHGTGSNHYGIIGENQIAINITPSVCARCHDAGTHHYFPDQWKYSGYDATEFDGRGFHGGHAIGAFAGYAGGRAACAACHSGAGYIQWEKEGKPVNDLGLPTSIAILPDATIITCAVCHDPHDAAEVAQLRLSETQLGDGTPITYEKYGSGAQCMECHRSRRNAAEYTMDPSNGSSHYGAHHGPQADMLIGTNAPDFGIELPSSPHALQGNACVDCHMSGENAENLYVGGHSFNMNDASGVDNVEACAPCHGNVGESFKEKKYYFNGVADHDGDGIDEGVQEEVKGMLEILKEYLPQDGDGNVDMSGKDHPVNIYKAGYSYMWVEEDRSFGIHNPAFTVGLLKAAIELLEYKGITAGKIWYIDDIPEDQGLQVRVVWTAFGADDGVAQDQVEKYMVLRQAPVGLKVGNVASYNSIAEIPASLETGVSFRLNGELWEQVAEVSAVQFTEYAAVVPTLHNTVKGDTAWTYFKVLGQSASGVIAETEPMAGYSVDNLAPQPPMNLAVALGENGESAELHWEMYLDANETLKYYKVYRDGEQIGTSAKEAFVDNNVVDGTEYTYYVTAEDYGLNESEKSNQVSLVITDIAIEDGIPTEYALGNNYPNPFNPTTNIKFAIPQSSRVRLSIYDATGKMVNVLVNKDLAAGNYEYTWNAANLATGVYFYRIESGSFVDTKKMLLIK